MAWLAGAWRVSHMLCMRFHREHKVSSWAFTLKICVAFASRGSSEEVKITKSATLTRKSANGSRIERRACLGAHTDIAGAHAPGEGLTSSRETAPVPGDFSMCGREP